MTTLDDAIDALADPVSYSDVGIVREFLASLKSKAEPLKIATDAEGFILEHAMDSGFSTIDDDIELMVVSSRKLIDFVRLRQGDN